MVSIYPRPGIYAPAPEQKTDGTPDSDQIIGKDLKVCG